MRMCGTVWKYNSIIRPQRAVENNKWTFEEPMSRLLHFSFHRSFIHSPPRSLTVLPLISFPRMRRARCYHRTVSLTHSLYTVSPSFVFPRIRRRAVIISSSLTLPYLLGFRHLPGYLHACAFGVWSMYCLHNDFRFYFTAGIVNTRVLL